MSKLLSFENSNKMVEAGYLTKDQQNKMIKDGKVSTPPKMHYAPIEIKDAWDTFETIVDENRKLWISNLPEGQTIGKVTINISK